MDLDVEELWEIDDGKEKKTLINPDSPWKVTSILRYEKIRTMLRVWAEIRGLRIMGSDTRRLEVTLGYSVNRTLNYKHMVRIFKCS